MPPSEESTYLVDAYNDPILVRVVGRASYLNCSPLNDFLKSMMAKDKKNFLVDFSQCTTMDSTFLGILAGSAIGVMAFDPPGVFAITNLKKRNRELVENLGLHKILEVVDSVDPVDPEVDMSVSLDPSGASSQVILEAHENLVQVDESNLEKFQDVLTFLRTELEE